jgi:urease accessory protein
MMRKSIEQFLAWCVLFGISSTAFAHAGHDASGLAAGLMHPFTGTDHLLAMFAVGLWAAQSGGRKVWSLPTAFMLMLTAGAGLAQILPTLRLIELGIAASVLLLGLIVALSMKLPALLCVALTALFGLMHGYAHGVEMPGAIEPAAYALGFLAATATLHLSGIAIGITTRGYGANLVKALGIGIATSGVWMLSTV